MIVMVLGLWWTVLSAPAQAAERFAGDKRLECEYEKVEWKRVLLIGQLLEPKVDPCATLGWTEEGERLWRSHQSALERHDRCAADLWQRRLAYAGGCGLLGVVGLFTMRQITGDRGHGSQLAVAGLGGVALGGLVAWVTERSCPAMPVPEWAR